MGTQEKRESLRVPCSYPVRVYGQLQEFSGRLCDISRTGARLRVGADRLLAGGADLASMTRALDMLLGSSFLADLHHEMLGPLVRKQLHLIRLGSFVDEGQGTGLEIGCLFDAPLTDEEATMLGIGLPPTGVTTPTAFQDVPAPRRRGETAEPEKPRPQPYEAYLHPTEGHTGPPLLGETAGMEHDLAVVSFPRDALGGAVTGVSGFAAELGRRYGPAPRLEILDGLRMLWAGPVRLGDVSMAGPEAERVDVYLGPGAQP
jgi:hypothetical protein